MHKDEHTCKHTQVRQHTITLVNICNYINGYMITEISEHKQAHKVTHNHIFEHMNTQFPYMNKHQHLSEQTSVYLNAHKHVITNTYVATKKHIHYLNTQKVNTQTQIHKLMKNLLTWKHKIKCEHKPTWWQKHTYELTKTHSHTYICAYVNTHTDIIVNTSMHDHT